MKRLKLIAARVEAGFLKQEEFVDALRDAGVDINTGKYSNIENGISKHVEVYLALNIAEFLKKDPRDIFLLIPTQKLSRDANVNKAC